LRIVCLAGGVGGAKLAEGFAKMLDADDFSVIVNTGDDFEHLSLKISPDLDTVCYTLAGLANPTTGWGYQDDTWATFDAISALGGPAWFHLGDRDLATHLLRTAWLAEGKTLYEITRRLCSDWGIKHKVYPMSNQPVRTIVHTVDGRSLPFQEYFVKHRFQPAVKSFEFAGIENAKPLPEGLEAIAKCDVVVIAPSNPWVSIAPILSVRDYRDALIEKPVVAVSPIIGGKALKGPAAKMYQELGIDPSAAEVAKHYQGLINGFVFDWVDQDQLEKIRGCRIIPLITDIIMKDNQDRIRLAEVILEFCESILK
jgi:LPPG:FO 2-phospho-L-lactate transferase